MRKLARFVPILTLIVLAAMLSGASPYFLTVANLTALARQTSVINIMALGMTIIIIAGGIDLSVGSMLGLCGVAGTMAMASGAGVSGGIAVGVATGFGAGLLNGLLITRLNIAPFIVTLGTLGIYRGATLLVTNGLPVHAVPSGFRYLGEGNLLGVPFVLWLLAACAVVMHFVLEHTRLGRYAFAIGSNEAAAVYSGIRVPLYKVTVYGIGGLLTGLAGMINASRLMTGQPTAGTGYELQAIAAVVIGGGSLHGGEGSVVGTLIGAFIMGLLANGSDLLGISNYLQQIVIGAVIILAVTVDEFRKRRTL